MHIRYRNVHLNEEIFDRKPHKIAKLFCIGKMVKIVFAKNVALGAVNVLIVTKNTVLLKFNILIVVLLPFNWGFNAVVPIPLNELILIIH